jgi:hypothetical protein
MRPSSAAGTDLTCGGGLRGRWSPMARGGVTADTGGRWEAANQVPGGEPENCPLGWVAGRARQNVGPVEFVEVAVPDLLPSEARDGRRRRFRSRGMLVRQSVNSSLVSVAGLIRGPVRDLESHEWGILSMWSFAGIVVSIRRCRDW